MTQETLTQSRIRSLSEISAQRMPRANRDMGQPLSLCASANWSRRVRGVVGQTEPQSSCDSDLPVLSNARCPRRCDALRTTSSPSATIGR